MGNEICRAVLGILYSGFLPGKLKMTNVTLIPKVKCPMSVKEY